MDRPAQQPDDTGAPAVDARTQQLAEDDHRYLWHPFTQQQQWVLETPLVIERGEGCRLLASDGRWYLDGNSSLWVNLWGHDRPEIKDAMKAQLDKVPHATFLGLTNAPAIEAAKRLVELCPDGITRAFFSENGAAAVEVALKMAFAYHRHRGDEGRDLFVCLDNAYHGDTLGAVSVGGFDPFHELFGPLLFETRRIPSPYCYRCPLGLTFPSCELACADALDDVLATEGHRVAAVVTEPLVQGAAGIITAPDGHLRRLREICDRHGVLLIVDEVAVGFGRTGATWASELEGITPDIMACGKALTGGYTAMSATLTTEAIYEAFLGGPQDGKTLYHGHSYAGNPLAAAAAVANLELFVSENVPAMVRAKAEVLAQGLRSFDGVAGVGDVRRRGLMAGVELVADVETKRAFDPALAVGKRVCDALRQDDIILRPLGDVLVILPAPAMTDEDILLLCERAAARTAEVVAAL